MTTKRTLFFLCLLACFCLLAVPQGNASAQGNYDPYYDDDDDDYRYRRNRRNDDRYGNNRNGNQTRYVRDAVKRLEDRSDDFRGALDRALDDSRYDNSNREDRILDIAGEFEEATDDLSESYNNRNVDEKVRRVLDLGSRLDRFVSRNRLDNRAENLWSQIRQDLRVVANAYGYRSGGIFDNGNRRNDDYRRYPNNRRRNSVGTVLGDIFGNRY